MSLDAGLNRDPLLTRRGGSFLCSKVLERDIANVLAQGSGGESRRPSRRTVPQRARFCHRDSPLLMFTAWMYAYFVSLCGQFLNGGLAKMSKVHAQGQEPSCKSQQL
jgi:hypothetical protein